MKARPEDQTSCAGPSVWHPLVTVNVDTLKWNTATLSGTRRRSGVPVAGLEIQRVDKVSTTTREPLVELGAGAVQTDILR